MDTQKGDNETPSNTINRNFGCMLVQVSLLGAHRMCVLVHLQGWLWFDSALRVSPSPPHTFCGNGLVSSAYIPFVGLLLFTWVASRKS